MSEPLLLVKPVKTKRRVVFSFGAKCGLTHQQLMRQSGKIEADYVRVTGVKDGKPYDLFIPKA